MIRTIHLHGALADRYGSDPVRLDCDSLPLMISGLESAFPGFRARLSEYSDLAIITKRGDKYDALTKETLLMRFGKAEEIHVAAAEQGAGAEAAAAFAAWVAEAGTAAYYVAYAVAYIAVTAAIAYAVGAVITSMSDVTSTDGKNSAEERSSTLFNGAVNSREQGGAVPLLYGMFLVGGTVISGEIVSERVAVALADYYSVTTGDAFSYNVLSNDILSAVSTVSTFSVGSTTTSAGGTITGSGYSVSIAANGAVTGSASADLTLVVGYTSVDGTGLQTSSTLTITATTPPVDYYNYGGGGGSDGSGDGPGSSSSDGGVAGGTNGSAGDGTGDGSTA